MTDLPTSQPIPEITFTVPGIKPTPQGSKKTHVARDGTGAMTGKVAMREMGKHLKIYREAIGWAASAAAHRAALAAPICVPVSVTIFAVFARPAKPAIDSPIGRSHGDVDKIARAVLDGITGVIIADDRYVTHLSIMKVFGPDPSTTVLITDADRTGAAAFAKLVGYQDTPQ